jgi:hypothetical protein
MLAGGAAAPREKSLSERSASLVVFFLNLFFLRLLLEISKMSARV